MLEQQDAKKLILEIGQNIKRIRVEKNIPPKVLAFELDLTTQQLGNIENGKLEDLGIKKIFDIANIMKIDYNEILKVSNSSLYNNVANNNIGSTYFQSTINSTLTAEEIVNMISQILKKRN